MTHWYIQTDISYFKHGEAIKWKYFPRYWPFMRGIHRSPVNSPHKGQWSEALKFSLICAWTNCWINNHEAGDLRRYRAHYDVIVMNLKEASCLPLVTSRRCQMTVMASGGGWVGMGGKLPSSGKYRIRTWVSKMPFGNITENVWTIF